MKKRTSIVWVLVFITGLIPGVAKAKLVACVGDSITDGWGITNQAANSYPAQLAVILRCFDGEWETQNFGHSGATLLRNKGASYVAQNVYDRALASEPDVVIIMLGSNDSARASISEIERNFTPDYLALIDAFAQLPSQPEIFVCYPPPIFGGGYGNNNTIRDVIIPLIEQLPTYGTVEVIDLNAPLAEARHLFPDNLHPNAEGARVIAEVVASVLLGFRFSPDFNGDWKVDIEDLILLIEHWGQNVPSFDIVPAPSGDGQVDRADLEVLMAYWEQELNDPSLVVRWRMDETDGSIAYDSIGANDGMCHGEPLWQPAGGKLAGALECDGIDDYVSTDPVLNPADGPFSVVAWIKGGAPGQVLLSQTGGASWLCMDSVAGCLMTELKGTGRSASALRSQTNIIDGAWYEVGLVWDGLYRCLYVDQVEVARDATALPAMEGSEGGLYLGVGNSFASGTFFSGLIDEVRIYSLALEL